MAGISAELSYQSRKLDETLLLTDTQRFRFTRDEIPTPRAHESLEF
jgi:hypothetical protein